MTVERIGRRRYPKVSFIGSLVRVGILFFWTGFLLSELALAETGDPADEPSGSTEELSIEALSRMTLEELATIVVSPFEVSTGKDVGFRASNSVSASRFDAPIIELPFAIQAFNTSFIEDQQPRDIFDIARYSPGVTYRSNDFNEGNANLSIRGFAVSSTPGNVQMLRDGFHGPSIFDMTNISRVEVVKGPSSFLYGQVAPGGIVNVITKTPESRFAADVDVRYGTDNQYRFEADVTGPVTDTLFYRLAASYDQDIDYWEPYDADSVDVAPSIRWQPNDRWSVTVKYEYFRKDEQPQLMQKPGYSTQSGFLPTPADPNLSAVDVPALPDDWNGLSNFDFRDSETSQLSSWIDFKVNDHWDLRAGFSHLDYEIDALFSGNFGMANNTTLLQGRRVRFQTYTNRDDTYEFEAVGKYTFSLASLRLLIGAQYVDRQFDNRAGQAPNDPALGTDPTASPLPLWDLTDPSTWNRNLTVRRSLLTENAVDRTTDFVDKSVYAGATVGFIDDRLLVLVGGRTTWTQSRLKDYLTGQGEPGNTARAVTPQYGLLYKLIPELSLFASYAESFVPGTQTLNNPDGTSSAADPTEGRGYDVGVKASLLEGRLLSTLTFFDITNENIINDLATTNAFGTVIIANVQSGEQRSTGVEWDATVALADKWQLYLSYSYMDARITEFSGDDDAVLDLNPSVLTPAEQLNYKNVARFHNAPLQMSAPHIGNLWTRYDFTRESLQGLYLAGGVNVVHDQTLLPDTPDFAHQSYVLVNAMAGYSWKAGSHRLSIDLVGKNLSDEVYRPSQSTRSRPREFLLTLTTEF